jgi:hypothetical protein
MDCSDPIKIATKISCFLPFQSVNTCRELLLSHIVVRVSPHFELALKIALIFSKDDDRLEDGDLPSLRKACGPSLLNWGTLRFEPLKPSSMFGFGITIEVWAPTEYGAFLKVSSEWVSFFVGKRSRGGSKWWNVELGKTGKQRTRLELLLRSDDQQDYQMSLKSNRMTSLPKRLLLLQLLAARVIRQRQQV